MYEPFVMYALTLGALEVGVLFGILAPHLGTCAGQRGCAGRAGFTHLQLGFKLSAATVLGIEQCSNLLVLK